jgi:16S rRNA (guanine527-N7)-methyltransferase
VVTDLLPADVRVVDVGSGAGLPGLVLAIRRPDLRIDCVESIRRRTDFLSETVASLGLEERVRVVHGRIEDAAVRDQVGDADWITARAVAPLPRLVGWSLPALAVGGCLLAIKGAAAAAELADARPMLRRSGADAGAIVDAGAGLLDQPTTVIVIRRTGAHTPSVRRKGRG